MENDNKSNFDEQERSYSKEEMIAVLQRVLARKRALKAEAAKAKKGLVISSLKNLGKRLFKGGQQL